MAGVQVGPGWLDCEALPFGDNVISRTDLLSPQGSPPARPSQGSGAPRADEPARFTGSKSAGAEGGVPRDPSPPPCIASHTPHGAGGETEAGPLASPRHAHSEARSWFSVQPLFTVHRSGVSGRARGGRGSAELNRNGNTEVGRCPPLGRAWWRDKGQVQGDSSPTRPPCPSLVLTVQQ